MFVIENGIDRGLQTYNLLTDAGNQNWGAVLAEPFPCLMSQWVTDTFVNNYSQL
jgi:hypothetical protein